MRGMDFKTAVSEMQAAGLVEVQSVGWPGIVLQPSIVCNTAIDDQSRSYQWGIKIRGIDNPQAIGGFTMGLTLSAARGLLEALPEVIRVASLLEDSRGEAQISPPGDDDDDNS